jgi:hypothetical protein
VNLARGQALGLGGRVNSGVDIVDGDELPDDLRAAVDRLGWSDDVIRMALSIHCSERLTEMLGPRRPDPIETAKAERAMDLAHSGAWPGPAPRSPATTRPIPPPPGERLALARRPDGRIVRPRQRLTKALIAAGTLDHDDINARPRTP